ncbi:peptidoglycan editing factor PgeF [Estrella lausannensis]|uniref:Purine nucleoside phosphorylase n=1 Tax=Estrella lausannensis TaxID=483423 RepID=A0A0H5DSQ8_9BACT|nr:peptidoglycan editing factor PgeF [Estrella lausannensis]CRX38834.1 Putative laccase [Estrella lausannensis]
MIRKEKNGVAWLEFELFQQFKEVRHGIFLRKGGVSSGEFSSLNIGFKSEDSQENILENLNRSLKCLDVKEWRRGRLNHGSTVVLAEEAPSDPQFQFDGLATKREELALVITHADCQAALFYDPVNRALANIHSGWRGSVLNIYSSTIRFMQERFGSRPENLFVGISPSLGPEDAEFIHFKKELPRHFWPFQPKENYFDFWEISKAQLQEAGVPQSQIQIAGISTVREPEDFFSYRRDKGSGRNATIAALAG